MGSSALQKLASSSREGDRAVFWGTSDGERWRGRGDEGGGAGQRAVRARLLLASFREGSC